MKLHSFSSSQKWSRMCLQRPQKGEAFRRHSCYKSSKVLERKTYRPPDNLDHLITSTLDFSPLSVGQLLAFQAHQPRDPDCRVKKDTVLKGQSKHDCKHKPENSPAASVNILPNTQPFTDKRKPKHQQSKIMQNICSRQILHSYSSLIFRALITTRKGGSMMLLPSFFVCTGK